MKNKYSIAIKLIITFYILTVIVGVGQIWWEIKLGEVYESPTVDGFYMGYRLILSIAAIVLFFVRKRVALYWVMAIDSTINIFIALFCIYCFFWYPIQYKSLETARYMVEEAGIEAGWNSLLLLISCIILGYIISTFKNIIPNKSSEPT